MLDYYAGVSVAGVRVYDASGYTSCYTSGSETASGWVYCGSAGVDCSSFAGLYSVTVSCFCSSSVDGYAEGGSFV